MLALVVLLSLGTTTLGVTSSGAWFSDTWSSAGSILLSGSLDFDVTGGPMWATNLQPGPDFAPLGEFCTTNTGTLPLKYRGQFESAAPITHDLLRYTTLQVEQHTTGQWAWVREIPGTAPVETDSLPYFFKHPGQAAEVVNPFVVAGSLAAGERLCYRLSVKLDPLTPDTQQGQIVDFVLHLHATQIANPAWP